MKRFMALMLTACLTLSSACIAMADDIVVTDDSVISEVVAEDGVVTDVEEVIVDEDSAIVVEEDADAVSFSYRETVDGYLVTLSADAGVLPEGTTVTVKKADDAREAEIAALVAAGINELEAVETSATFDFEFKDAQGNVVEPENGDVKVSIGLSSDFASAVEAAGARSDVKGVDIRVFHVEDNNEIEFIDSVSADECMMAEEVSFGAASFSSYSLIVVTRDEEDTEAPEIYSMKIKNNSVSWASILKDKKMPTVVVDAEDDLSGIKEIKVEFMNEDVGNTIVTTLKKKSKDSDDTIYEGVAPINVYTTPNGKYSVYSVEASDNAGNVFIQTGSGLDSSFKKSFKLTGDARYNPSVANLQISPGEINLNTKAEIPVTVAVAFNDNTALTKSAVANVELVPLNGSERKTYSVPLSVTKSSGSSIIMAGTVGISYKNAVAGTMVVTDVTAYGVYSGTIFSATKSLAEKTIPQATAKLGGGDVKAPEVTGFIFDRDKVTVSSKVEVKVSAAVTDDLSGVASVKAVLSNGDEMIVINNFVQPKGAALFTGTVKLSSNLPAGKYKVTHVEATDNAGNVAIYDKSKKTIPASWSKIYIDVISSRTYTIEFDANGGKGSMKSIKAATGEAEKLPANKFKRTGYTFKCWNTDPDGDGKSYRNQATVKDLTKKADGEVTLYAQWKANEYTVTFKAGSGCKSSSKSYKKTYKYGKSYKYGNKFTAKDGKEFVGWCKDKDGDGKIYKDIKNLTSKNKGKVTLYAICE